MKSSEAVEPPGIQARARADGIFPIVQSSVDAQLLHRKSAVGSCAIGMHSLNVDYPVNFVILVNLVGDNIVEYWSIPPPILKLTVVLVFADEFFVGTVSVGHSRRELDGLVVVACGQSC